MSAALYRPAQLVTLLAEAPSLSRALAWWVGAESLRIDVHDTHDRPVRDVEINPLQCDRLTAGHERTGSLRTRAGRDVASTRLLVLPDRIPRQVRLLAGIPHRDDPDGGYLTSVPFGVAMGCLGNRFRRIETTVRWVANHPDSPPATTALICTAVLTIDGGPVGLTTELIPPAVSTDTRTPAAVADYLATAGRGARRSPLSRRRPRIPIRSSQAEARPRRAG